MDEQNRFVSIGDNPIDNRRYNGFRRVLINRNNNIINDNYIYCNFSKTKIILLLIITIILSLSNYFYNWNNNISIIADEPRTILSIFDNNIFKINPPLNDQKKISQIRNLKEEKNNRNNKNISSGDNNNNKNKIDNKDEFDIFSDLSLLKEFQLKKKIFNNLNNYYYKFNWTSIKTNNKVSPLYKIGDSSHGEGIFKILKETRLISEHLLIKMKAHELSFIDNWIFFSSFFNLESFSFNYEEIKKTNSIELNGIFSTTLFKGEFFDVVNEDEPKYCQTKYKLKFNYEIPKPELDKKNYSLLLENVENIGNIYINLDNLEMLIESSCGFNFQIKANIYDNKKENAIIEKKIIIYCLITGLTGLFYVFGIYSIIYNIKKSENVISVISSDCLLINPIWNTYIALEDINIAMRININFYPLLLLIIFNILKFIYFDFYLLALYWKKKRNYISVRRYIKERLRFYLIYYIISFCSFTWINIFFNYALILLLCICLWIPQIIFNIKRNNRYSFPFIYILSSTLDKLIYPIYFRAFKDNFISSKVNANLITIMVLFVFFTIIILYAQIFSEPRFMLPKSYHKNEFNFYKSRQELISIKKDIELEECVICLSPIFEIELNQNNKMIEMEDKSSKNSSEEKLDNLDDSTNNSSSLTNSNIDEEGEEIDKIIISNNIKKSDNTKLIEENNDNNNNHKKENIILTILKIIKILFSDNFFSFYKKKSASNGELYMLTPCSHVFHSECLEKWFEFKKECPNCRISMKEYLE